MGKALCIVEATDDSGWQVEALRLKVKTYLQTATRVEGHRKRNYSVETAKNELKNTLQTVQKKGAQSLALQVVTDMAELELLEEKAGMANQLLTDILTFCDFRVFCSFKCQLFPDCR